MTDSLPRHIQKKIEALKHEMNSIQYTASFDKVSTIDYKKRIHECACKIQVLNEIIISYKI